MQIRPKHSFLFGAGPENSGVSPLFTSRFVPIFVLVVLLLPAGILAAVKKRAAAQDHSSAAGAKGAPRLSGSRTSRTARRHRGPRLSDYKRRIAKIHLEPDRVQEIQRALTQAGYLHQEPDGQWNVETRAAMERYQQNSGFSPTGLPDARSLMKLGLGPHPLPPAADPNAAKTTANSTLAGTPQNPQGAGSDHPE
jgi:peptidoglycan hydrolase-like protein with peptidoglycan-binding domain